MKQKISVVNWLSFLRTLFILAAGASLALVLVARENKLATEAIMPLSANTVHDFQRQLDHLQTNLTRLEHSIAKARQEEAEVRASIERELHSLKQHQPATLEHNILTSDPSFELLELQQESEAENHYKMRMEEQYQNEQRDETWANRQEHVIEKLLSSTPMFEQLYLEDIQCRSTSCKLRLERRGETAPHVEQALLGELGRELSHAAWQENGAFIELTLSQHELNDNERDL